ncbi:MAG TPA: TadE/TadG family type IV pilus assembly protein, partial [Chloroflexota bacterium]
MRPKHFSPLRMLRDLWADRRAVTAVTVALLVPVLVGLAGFTIDIGHLALVQKELQSSTDAAALAGGYAIPDSNAVSTATTYGAGSGDKNTLAGGVTGSMVTGYPKLKCLSTTSVNCVGTELGGGANAIQVRETASVPMWFAQILGFGSYTLTSTSTASARGGIGESLNVMIILDTTQSMQSGIDNGCGLGSSSTRLQCAEAGVKALLTGLNPNLDYVGLMVFPGLQSTSEASNAATCGQSTNASDLQQYGNSPVYQIAALNNNFKASSTSTTLNTGSSMALAIGQGGSGCTSGVSAPGGEGTYFADVFNQAQAKLVALSSSQSPPAQNVIVFLSDGGANATKIQTSYSAWIGTCTTSHGVTTCNASTTMTVTTCSPCAGSSSTSQQGPLAPGDTITSGAAAGTTIVSQLTGTTGGVGTYVVSTSQKVGSNTSSTSMVAASTMSMNGDTYPENRDECQQTIDASRAAANAGTWVYSIAYGANNTSGDCTTDTTSIIAGMANLSSCTEMANIANSPGHLPDLTKFYSNGNSGAVCTNALATNTISNLVSLFSNLST